MSQSVYVQPAVRLNKVSQEMEPRKVYHPRRKAYLPADHPTRVVLDQYWARTIADGDLVVVPDPSTASPAKGKGGK